MWTIKFGIVLLVITSGVQAETQFELKGKNHACRDASTMNLWHISGDSPLVRYEMTQKNYCWKTVQGLRVREIGEAGQFVHVEYVSNSLSFFTYRSNLGPISIPKTPPPEKIDVRKSVLLRTVSNTTPYGVVLIGGKPTVEFVIDAGGGLVLDISIVKEKIQSGFEQRITSQYGNSMQVGGRCKNNGSLGLESSDHFQLKVLAVDHVKRYADFEVSGEWHKCDLTRGQSYKLQPSVVRIGGEKFIQLMRKHTDKEMSKTIP